MQTPREEDIVLVIAPAVRSTIALNVRGTQIFIEQKSSSFLSLFLSSLSPVGFKQVIASRDQERLLAERV